MRRVSSLVEEENALAGVEKEMTAQRKPRETRAQDRDVVIVAQIARHENCCGKLSGEPSHPEPALHIDNQSSRICVAGCRGPSRSSRWARFKEFQYKRDNCPTPPTFGEVFLNLVALIWGHQSFDVLREQRVTWAYPESHSYR